MITSLVSGTSIPLLATSVLTNILTDPSLNKDIECSLVFCLSAIRTLLVLGMYLRVFIAGGWTYLISLSGVIRSAWFSDVAAQKH